MKEHLGSATKTALAVLTWIILDSSLPKFENEAQNVARALAGTIIATAVVYGLLIFVQWRPRFHLRAESLPNASASVGRRVDVSPFTPPLVGGSAWFLIYVEHRCDGWLAKWMAQGLKNPGNVIEIEFDPAASVVINVEKPNGAVVRPLGLGRRGASIELPNPSPKGSVAVFQIEVRPVLDPVPLPLTTKLTLIRGQGEGERRLRATHLSSDLREIRINA